jgi:hypothetical protein
VAQASFSLSLLKAVAEISNLPAACCTCLLLLLQAGLPNLLLISFLSFFIHQQNRAVKPAFCILDH